MLVPEWPREDEIELARLIRQGLKFGVQETHCMYLRQSPSSQQYTGCAIGIAIVGKHGPAAAMSVYEAHQKGGWRDSSETICAMLSECLRINSNLIWFVSNVHSLHHKAVDIAAKLEAGGILRDVPLALQV